MKRLLIVVCLAMSPASFAFAADPPTQKLLYLSEQGPIFIQLRIEIDGGSYEAPWDDFIDKLFADLDRDGDGQIQGEEATRIPTSQQLAQTGLVTRTTASKPSAPVSKQALGEYLRKISGGPFSLNMATNRTNTRRLQPTMRNNAAAIDIFEKLDANEDGKLSTAEFAMTKSLRKMDLDDDETINATELQPATSPYAFASLARNTQTGPAKNSAFVHLDGGQRPTQLVKRLIEKYDVQEKDQKLSRKELGMSVETFAKLDADGEGQLDFDELHQFVRKPIAPLDILVRLGKRKGKQEAVEVEKLKDEQLANYKVRKLPTGMAAIVVGKVQVEIGPDANSRGVRQNLEATYKQLLTRYDRDNNAYLEKKETERTQFNATFDFIDVDGDGKIFEKELVAYAKQVEAATMSRTTMTISDQGNKLFQVLDTNHDGRLNVRELRAARAKVSLWDEDGDKQITKEEIPRHWQLALTRGNSRNVAGFRTVSYATGGRPAGRPPSGPVWFQRMDRNGDGDVTEREFLGSSRDFKSLDKDKDRLISATEAKAISATEE